MTVAAFLIMVYAVNIVVLLPPVLRRTDLWPFDQALSDPLGHIFGSAVPAFLVVAAMPAERPSRSRLEPGAVDAAPFEVRARVGREIVADRRHQ